ncbi:hypothetical protein WX45_01227 [Clostridium ljungdahlii DSM 13528]|uniref:Uncharacterized protein n=1 Tax=Clostridium ljungdahlii (strain ATCC 55383 / DSM 13528 / PETC) TaxID=748727 RepID=D8GTB5_CLOLD|nr:conserved hypothetical protein [Clostridium ljungdahlii DSM 13528]ALU35937.1 Hypothetical protein CLAU_1508 [Clostridium autoethanogenum DSM 10061]OAA89410.1 hypothetical protein WX45_01227 [Clostridium ljungdahlii DSM 13528]OVY52005.1 hypothetical protein WX72_00882 [Clostridium autoethanogenum]
MVGVNILKYIGPFLRINKVNPANIKNQLFYLSKESLKEIVLHSECGVSTPVKELDIKNIPNFDINTFKGVSPLICIYRKANPILINMDNKLCWNQDKFKKEINIDSNTLMTLCLLELCDYYNLFNNIDKRNYNLGKLYESLCKSQLKFYALHFRNNEGVFTDKKLEDGSLMDDLKFADKNKKFKFSSQALLMAAYYKCSTLLEGEEREDFRNFSFDILNMLIKLKEDLYDLSFEELTRLCFGLNIFYSYSKDLTCKDLILDISELIFEKFYSDNTLAESLRETDVENDSLNYINYMLIYKYTNIIKSKDNADFIFKRLLKLYDAEKGLFIKNTSKKNIEFTCLEIMLYLIVFLIDVDVYKDKDKNSLIVLDIFKRQLIDSGIILSWPDAPDLSSAERYENFSLKSEDLREEQNFKTDSIPSPESCEIAPVFTKYVTYSRKKESFKSVKTSFDAYKNMSIFFLVIHLLSPKIAQ